MRTLVSVQISNFASVLTSHSGNLRDEVTSLSVALDTTQADLKKKKEDLQELGSIHVPVIWSRANCFFRRV
jgi:hypothetical protein